VISVPEFPPASLADGGHSPEVIGEAAEQQPIGRDRGCGLVALIAALLFVGSVVGAIIQLYADGLSFSLVFGLVVSLLFWYWIAMGAWRRTTCSSRS
jgi:hypothetical protein